jgi:hypothetical protein
MPTFPTHAVVPLHTTSWLSAAKSTPYVLDHVYEPVWQGLPSQHPDVVNDESVLNGCLVPDGTQPFTHVPPLQYGVVPLHAFVQLPQLELFDSTSTHDPAQYICPGGQQLPLLHHSVDVQGIPHMPQLSWSFWRSKHTPVQSVMPDGHATPHVLASHVGVPVAQPALASMPPLFGTPESGLFVPGGKPPASPVLHVVVHWPQWFGSVARVAQMDPASTTAHLVVGEVHVAAHMPLEQTSPVMQAFVHEPQ